MGKTRILLIEDDDLFGSMICAKMESVDFKVDWARSWKEAEAFFTPDAAYALVFTDNDFPGGNSFKSVETAKRLWGDIPVFLISGRADEVGAEFEALGGDRVFDKSEIREAIAEAIGYVNEGVS